MFEAMLDDTRRISFGSKFFSHRRFRYSMLGLIFRNYFAIVAEFGNQIGRFKNEKRREQRGRNTRPCDLAGFTGSRCNNTISDTHASMVNLRGGNAVTRK